METQKEFSKGDNPSPEQLSDLVTSQEINDSIEIIDAPEPENVELESEAESTPEPTDKKFVEFDTPEQQEKFNDIYKQMKMSDQRNQMLTEFLMEQQKQLEEVKGRFSQTDESEAEQ